MATMNDKLFDNLMSAVDEDLLEEAQRPIKTQRKLKTWATLAVSAAACVAVIAAAVLHTPKQPQTTQPGGTMIVKPMQNATLGEVEKLGYRMILPESAQDAKYYIYNLGSEQETPMAEVRFMRNGESYTCRALKTAAGEDISGLYADWNRYYTWNADAMSVTVMAAEDLTACASWYEEETGVQWCLSGKLGASDVLNTANEIMNELGYDLSVAPSGAENIAFRALEPDGLTVGETTFVLNGVTYTYRIAATNAVEEEFADISGVQQAFAAETAGEVGWCSARLYFDEGAEGKIVWFDIAPGLLYSLHMDRDASETALTEAAELLYDPAQSDAG